MMGRTRIIAASTVLLVIAVGMMIWLLNKDESQESADANDPELVVLGQQVYTGHCAACHGARLEG
jgi:mono/diheme cytochrome c family protein